MTPPSSTLPTIEGPLPAVAAPLPACELTEADHAALAAIAARNPKAKPLARLPDVPPSRLPRHVAIIMDGNGRWAKQRGFPRLFGHRNGAAAVRATVEECVALGVECLTLYSFSMENWKRPADEVEALMRLYIEYMTGEAKAFARENIRLVQIGRREGLPEQVLALGDAIQSATAKNSVMTLCLAVNYGSRAEIVDAVRAIAKKAKDGTLDPAAIDDAAISSHLGTAGLPEPDLLIRTAGEMRLSNFLLWQLSYAELYVTQTLWPDFGVADLHAAVRAYAQRTRRFGGLAGV
ncbi:MAG: isoprenyl transferase [Phycisphaerales bacterium]